MVMLEPLTDEHAGRALLVCVRAVIRLLYSKVSNHPAVRASATPAVAFDSLPLRHGSSIERTLPPCRPSLLSSKRGPLTRK